MADLKDTAKRSRWGVIGGRIAIERMRAVRRVLGRRESPMGATHRRFDLEGSVAYVEEVFEDYLGYGELDRDDLQGRRVLELGPGDNLGVALEFAAAGAARTVATDRFTPFRDPGRERSVCEALIARIPSSDRERVAAMITADGVSLDDVPIEFHQELPIEDAPGLLGGEEFDLIVSRAVLEHVDDLETAFVSMDKLLAPGGLMVHKVDLSDHGLFTDGGQNPLTFLTIADRVYRWMGERTVGLPNRVTMGWYDETLERLGYEAELLITHLIGVGDEFDPHALVDSPEVEEAVRADLVNEVRPRLLPRYTDLADRELAISGFMIIARKLA